MPHLSAADREGPSKAIDGFCTVPMKVFNGVVHGDQVGHVILSPGVIGATANHTCECLGVMVNTAYQRHGDLPLTLTVQFDGASTNKCILVLAYLSLYVLEGVFAKVRVRCLLENHAHDVYDAFHAIHAAAVRMSTYYQYEELRQIIRGAHDRMRDEHTLRPLVGHDVQVNDLWELRDFWEWLAPGYSEKGNTEYALSSAAFTTYTGLSKLRDFSMELESGTTPENQKVGLWAKAYMTTAEYEYLGTVMTGTSFKATVGQRLPPLQKRDVSDQKTTRETTVLDKLTKATRSKLQEQFSGERLADAIATCRRDWAHFRSSPGKLKPEDKWLPAELAAAMREAGRRSLPSQQSQQSQLSLRAQQAPGFNREQGAAHALLDAVEDVRPLVGQRIHNAQDIHNFGKGPNVPSVKVGAKPPSAEEFRKRQVFPGSYVVTRPAPSGPWTKGAEHLKDLDFWVWRVQQVFEPGQVLPGFSKQPAKTYTYEAHLYQHSKGEGKQATWAPCFTDERPVFMKTADEKDVQRSKKIWGQHGKRVGERLLEAISKRSSVAEDHDHLSPVRCYLRPQNVVGGGFSMTPAKRVPAFVRKYVLEQIV